MRITLHVFTVRFGESLRTLMRTLLIVVLAPATVSLAQDPPPAAPRENPLSTHSKGVYGGLQKMLLRSAEDMPEENYSFKPTEDVRTFGQIVGHVADAQYVFCSAALGEKNPAPKVEKTKASKADLIAALKEAFAYCDRAYAGLTDANGTQTVRLMGRDWPKLGALNVNQVHGGLHYGNIITYMRLKNLVPPSSDPEFMKQLMN